MGPVFILGGLLKTTASEVAQSLFRIFNLSLSLGQVPANWKSANISPVFKKDDANLSSNYRRISLLYVLSKVLERCVYNHCRDYLSKTFYHLKGRSTTPQLLKVYHDILRFLANGKELDVIFLDLCKAFEKVPHHRLVAKFTRNGISGTLIKWFRSYL